MDGETVTPTVPTDEGGGGDDRLSWHAGGTYFPLSNEFKQIVESNTDFTLQVQSTGASVENVGSLAQGNADFALIQTDIAHFAKNGTGIDAFEAEPVNELLGVDDFTERNTRFSRAVDTVAVQAMTATDDDQSTSTVRRVTAATFDNTDQLTIKTEFVSEDTAQEGTSIELHPGAAAYLEA
jgi:TRAP-type uncharacterized transport system substrate-binding protein